MSKRQPQRSQVIHYVVFSGIQSRLSTKLLKHAVDKIYVLENRGESCEGIYPSYLILPESKESLKIWTQQQFVRKVTVRWKHSWAEEIYDVRIMDSRKAAAAASGDQSRECLLGRESEGWKSCEQLAVAKRDDTKGTTANCACAGESSEAWEESTEAAWGALWGPKIRSWKHKKAERRACN